MLELLTGYRGRWTLMCVTCLATAVACGPGSPPVLSGLTDQVAQVGTELMVNVHATDPDGDALTYQWEEFDLGAAGHPNDAATAGGVASEDYTVNVSAAAGPFRVMYPHAQTAYTENAQMTVQWLVANTTAAPVSCGAVDILLSTDRGQTFPTVLADDTPNDGSETVTIPEAVPGETLLKVKCSNNLFFALSTENFLQGLQPPALSIGSDYEAPDTDGAYTLEWTRPATGVGPDILQESASCGPVFSDDASEQLVAGANSKWSGSAQWTSQNDPNDDSPAYYIVDGSSQAEALSMIDAIDIPEGAVSTLTFTTSQDLESGYDFGRVRVNVDGAGFKTIVAWTGAYDGTRTVDLSQFAGHSIRIEFLLLSDEFSEDVYLGWYVSDIAITATVFNELATVAGTSHRVSGKPVGSYCYRARTTHEVEGQTGPSPYGNVVYVDVASTNLAPTANAGNDVTVDEGAGVQLAGSGVDPESQALTYEWTQTAGPTVALTGANTATPSFTAPQVDADSPLTFRLTVRDPLAAAGTDDVVVTVRNVAAQEPSAFSFVERTGVATSTFVTSETRTITGYAGSLPITIDNGGQYRIDGGAWTSAAGQIASGSTLAVRHVSAASESTTKSSRVTVGTYFTEFKTTTAATDRVPSAFTFGTKTGVAPGEPVASEVTAIEGFNAPASIVPGPGASYRIDGAGAFTTASGTLNPGQTLQVQHTASGTSLAYTKTYVKVGGVTGYFTTRTR